MVFSANWWDNPIRFDGPAEYGSVSFTAIGSFVFYGVNGAAYFGYFLQAASRSLLCLRKLMSLSPQAIGHLGVSSSISQC